MTDTTTNGTQVDDTQQQGQETEGGALRRQLEETLAENKALKEERTTLRREAAFTAAGIPTDGTGALIRKAYDGEADAEAIRSFAAEHGFEPAAAPEGEQTATDPAAQAQPDVPEATQQAAQAMQAAAATAGAPGTLSIDDRIAAASTIEEIEAIANEAGLGPRL